MIRFLFKMLLLLVAAAGIGIFLLYQYGLTIHLTEAELQERIEEPFPLEQRHLGLVTVVLSEPRVRLVDGSERIHYELRVRTDVTGIGSVADVRAQVSGRVRYEPEEAAFFVDDFRVEDLGNIPLPAEQQGWVREAIGVAVREALQRYPVYRLGPGDLREVGARLVLREVKVVDQRLRLRLKLDRGESSSG